MVTEQRLEFHRQLSANFEMKEMKKVSKAVSSSILFLGFLTCFFHRSFQEE